ncbi:hypothetical protein RHMOL_Rhmol10G0036000 [Rhododendron molle]|uniref:Uncharacterized protein n=1 Tax=Rhododendron molle TaxID=49168 RepID=A0ACC0LYH1_RHOML|nr:hypothetical protein RHMOL_Rhmol10G0036000 [Rhododendron molle]
MAEGAVFHLLSNFAPYLQEEVNLLTGVREEIEDIRDEFERMTNFLRVADAVEETSLELKVWVKQVREAAYDTADALDMYMLRLGHQHGAGFSGFLRKVSCFIKTLKARHHIASEVKRIKSRFADISEGHRRYSNIYDTIEQGSSSTHSGIAWYDCRSDALLLQEADLVGIDKPKSQLIKWLVDEDPLLKVISVAGMGGLGKTTLAKKVYDDETVKRRFQTHVWITVSETFKANELLRDMIRQLCEEVRQPLPPGMDNMDTTRLKVTIKDFLQQKRYVIVLDDVWSNPAWQFFKIIFPECSCGSRIVLTTRNVDLASFASKEYHGFVHTLQPLPRKQSWELFCKKAFHGNPCPSYLVDLSRDILKRCQGLPLAIVAIGGLLSTKENNLDEWERIYRGLGAELESNDKLMSVNKILSLSYFDLPYYLKLCFLYLSIFPEDFFIDHWRLIRLWVAEGFVKVKEGKTKEEVAEDYINELRSRSLVQVEEMAPEGRVKTYRIHDLWREIVISKSREQNIVSIASAEKVRRLSIQNNMDDIQINCSTRLRSLLVFSKEDPLSMLSKVVSLGKGARLLTVLDLGGTQLQTFPNEILKLIHLTYLSLRGTKVKKIPKSIGDLKNLETLDLKRTDVKELPNEILKLQYLRHLLLYRFESHPSYWGILYRTGFKAPAGVGSLSSLQKLFAIEAKHGSDSSIMLRELGKLTQLRRLDILRLAKEDGKVLCSSLEKLNSLHSLGVHALEDDEIIDLDSLSSVPQRLQTLNLKGVLQHLPHWIPSLHNLKKLRLGHSKLRDVDPLQPLQDLPNLASISLWNTYEGDGLCFKAGRFQRLKRLSLRSLEGLRWVRVEATSMPLLEELNLRDCKLMMKLPSGVENLTKLKRLLFGNMPEVQGIAQTLETESGGILVTVERISKGFAILVYRGKNYKQPASLRPRTLLSKREELKRSIDGQRHKSLKLHALKLTRNVDELKLQLAREISGFDSSSFSSNDGTDTSTACPETNQQDMLRDSPLLFLDKVDEFNITEPEPLSELERVESRLFMGSNGLGVDAQSATCPDDPGLQGLCYLPAVNAESHGDEKAITPVESTKNGTNNSVHSPVENIPCGVPVRAEATGAVLVSQEINKVILYRGWGVEVEPGQTIERNDIKDTMKTSVGRKGEFWPVISPELLDAIRLECGLHRTPEDVK